MASVENIVSPYANIYRTIFTTLIGSEAHIIFARPNYRKEGKGQGTTSWPCTFPENSVFWYVADGADLTRKLGELVSSKNLTGIIVLPLLDASFFDSKKSAEGHVNMSSLLDMMGVRSDLKVALILPEVAYQLESNRQFREKLFTTCKPELLLVNEDGASVFPLQPSFKMGTIFFRTGAGFSPPLKFFRIPRMSKSLANDEVVKDFSHLFHQKGGQSRFGFVHREEIIPGQSIGYDRLHPSLTRVQESLSKYGRLRPLGELVDAFFGINFAAPPPGTIELAPDGSPDEEWDDELLQHVAIVSGAEIRSNGNIDYSDDYTEWEKGDPACLKPGDICVRANRGNEQNLTVAQVQEGDFPGIASSDVIVLRPKATTSEEERLLLFPFLRSVQASQYYSAYFPGLRVSPKALLQVPVPLAEPAVAQACREIRAASAEFAVLQKEASEAFTDIFEYVNVDDKRRYLLDIGAKLRRKKEACSLATDPKYVIRTQYPYPIAFRWRAVESSWPNLEGYINVLECAEITLCYLACLGLAVARRLGLKGLSKVTEIGERLSKGTGTTMGDWFSIIEQIGASKELAKQYERIPLYRAVRLLQDEEVKRLIVEIKGRRDDQAHGRGPKGAAIEEKFKEAKDALFAFITKCNFLADCGLIYIEETRQDSLTSITSLYYRELRGDHAFAPVDEATSERGDLEAHSLYARDQSGELLLLRPYLVGRNCPQCGFWSTFFLDRYNQKTDECVLKSMEHGHPFNTVSMAEAFRCVGFPLNLQKKNITEGPK